MFLYLKNKKEEFIEAFHRTVYEHTKYANLVRTIIIVAFSNFGNSGGLCPTLNSKFSTSKWIQLTV